MTRPFAQLMQPVIGRTRTAPVFGQGTSATAVLATMVADLVADAPPGLIVDAGVIEGDLLKHLNGTVMACVDHIASALHQPKRAFRLTAVAVGATAMAGLSVQIKGFSADMPILLALLSAACAIPLDRDVVTTGHLASEHGDLRLVKNLPAKIEAAANDPAIRSFICPSLDVDESTRTLTPLERRRVQEVMIDASEHLVVRQIRDLQELLQAVFSDQAVILGALRNGFFGVPTPSANHGHPTDRAGAWLLVDHERRFWCVLAHALRDGGKPGELLEARIIHQLRQKLYPAGIGGRLRRLALPPRVGHWTLMTSREKLIKIGAKVVRHARYVTFQLAEVAVPRRLYQEILRRIRHIAAIPPRAASA